jgi:PAS domain S-box-containing protein
MNQEQLIHEVESDPVLNLFLNSITDQAVLTVDAHGIIRTWSEGCRHIKGYTAAETIGHHFGMFYTPEDRERGHPDENLRMALKDGQYHEERIRVRKDGERFIAEVSIYPVKEKGQFIGFAKIVKDVSARRLLGKQRDAFREELRLSNLELESFCYFLAHDLHSPIRAIIAHCRIVQEDFSSALPPEARAHLETLVRNGLRLGMLVDDLLKFARLGHGELKRSDIDVSAMVQQLAKDLVPQCHCGNGSIEVQDGVRANADQSLLELVLYNLIENACKYSEPGVTIRFGKDIVEKQPIYHVQDTGIGFEMQYAQKLFEPFQRLHGNAAYKGTGIGLANVKRIVERHGGTVWAESVLGKGSTFFFTLS